MTVVITSNAIQFFNFPRVMTVLHFYLTIWTDIGDWTTKSTDDAQSVRELNFIIRSPSRARKFPYGRRRIWEHL